MPQSKSAQNARIGALWTLIDVEHVRKQINKADIARQAMPCADYSALRENDSPLHLPNTGGDIRLHRAVSAERRSSVPALGEWILRAVVSPVPWAVRREVQDRVRTSDGGGGADPVRHGSPGHAGTGDEALEAVRGTWVDMEFDGHAGLG